MNVRTQSKREREIERERERERGRERFPFLLPSSYADDAFIFLICINLHVYRLLFTMKRQNNWVLVVSDQGTRLTVDIANLSQFLRNRCESEGKMFSSQYPMTCPLVRLPVESGEFLYFPIHFQVSKSGLKVKLMVL